MKLVLKDKYIYIVEGTGLANNIVEAEVITKYVPDYNLKQFKYKINNGKYQDIINDKIKFKRDDLEKGYVSITVRATSEDGIEYFRAEKTPVTFAVVLGEHITDAYPEVIKSIIERQDRMDQVLVHVINTMEEVSKKGELL